MSWVTVILCWLSLKLIQCFVACIHFLCILMHFGMCLAVDHATPHLKSSSWKKGTLDGVLRFLVDSWNNTLRYQRPLHPWIFSHCENTAHSYLYKSALCLCLKVSCRSKYFSEISSGRQDKAQPAMFVPDSFLDARASRWAERWKRVKLSHRLDQCCSRLVLQTWPLLSHRPDHVRNGRGAVCLLVA